MKRTISFLLAVGAVLSTGATAGASGLDTLLDFAGTDVANPRYNLILDSGKLYGTTARGVEEGGTIFSVDTDGSNFTLLHQFFSAADSTEHPSGHLILDSGKLYGTSYHLNWGTPMGGGSLLYGYRWE